MHSENLQLFNEISWEFETCHQSIQAQSNHIQIHSSDFLWQEVYLEFREKFFDFKP